MESIRSNKVPVDPSAPCRHLTVSGTGRIALGLLALVLACRPVVVQAEETVEFEPLLVKTYNAKQTKAGFSSITINIQVADAKAGKYVCALVPKLRDALLRDVARTPLVQRSDGTVDTGPLEIRFLSAMRRVIKGNILRKVSVLHGAPIIGKRNSRYQNRCGHRTSR